MSNATSSSDIKGSLTKVDDAVMSTHNTNQKDKPQVPILRIDND